MTLFSINDAMRLMLRFYDSINVALHVLGHWQLLFLLRWHVRVLPAPPSLGAEGYVEGGGNHRSEESGEREANGEDEGGEKTEEGRGRKKEGRRERAEEERRLELLGWGITRAAAGPMKLCYRAGVTVRENCIEQNI